MFYAHCVLAKKSPLRKVWLAAHWQTKLTKAHVFQTSLEDSVSLILEPRVKISLRTSGHLLLGVTRILGMKARYLLADCTEACVKIRMVFQPRLIDLPEERREATRNAITLPDSCHDQDSSLLGDVEIPEDFVLSVDYDCLTFGEVTEEELEEGMETEEPEVMREASHGFISQNNLTGSHKLREDDVPVENTYEKMNSLISEDGFGGIGVDEDVALGNFGEMTEVSAVDVSASPSPPASPALPVAPPLLACSYLSSDLTVLFPNDQEAFALAPVLTDNGGQGPPRRRRRKLLVDSVKTISGEDLKARQRDYSSLVTSLTLAPPTRLLMEWEARARAGALLLGPARKLGPPLLRDFMDSIRNTAERQEDEEEQSLMNMASPGDMREDGTKRSMKRKKQQLANGLKKRSKEERKAVETSEPREEVYGVLEALREGGSQEDQEVLEDQEVFEDQEVLKNQVDPEVQDLGELTGDAKPTTEVEDDKATLLHEQLKENFPAKFSLLAGRRGRKEVAGLFRAVLELQRRGVLEVEQEEGGAGAQIVMEKGAGFGSDANQ